MEGRARTGALPAGWAAQAGGQLLILDVGNNTLNGTLPAEWADMQSMITMSLATNFLSGAFQMVPHLVASTFMALRLWCSHFVGRRVAGTVCAGQQKLTRLC